METVLTSADVLPVLEEILFILEQIYALGLFFIGCVGAIIVILVLYKILSVFI